MSLTERTITGQPPIFVFGFPRSGTTWLSKILDSSPDTLLRHEPDTLSPTREFPFAIAQRDIDVHRDLARAYLLDRCSDRRLRTLGGAPFFWKKYRSPAAALMHRAQAAALQGLDVASRGRLSRRVSVPDCLSSPDQVRFVMKSVDSAARVGLFAHALPECRFVFIIRHPCGVIGSRIRGIAEGRMGHGRAHADWVNFDLAQELGLGASDLKSWSPLEVSAWGWTFVNDAALRAIEGRSNVMVVRYEDLCSDPVSESRELFRFCGLELSEQTLAYLLACINEDDDRDGGFYSVSKNPIATRDRWKAELSDEDAATIRSVALKSRCGHDFFSADTT